MSRYTALLLFCLLPAGMCACGAPSRATSPATSPAIAQGTLPADCFSYAPDQFGEHIGNDNLEYASESVLSHQGYEIARRVKRERIDSSDYYADIEYAVLMKNRRVVATFDGEPGQNSEIRFAQFPFLGGSSKQLVVEQTSNRFWRYWVVNLSPKFEVIYDSGEYGTIHGLKTADPDGDGSYEIVQSLGAFWFFSLPENANATLNNVNSTRPDIIFRYDPARRKYLPANAEFQPLMLGDFERRIEKTRELNRGGPSCFPAVLDVVLRHVYAGREDEAWAFFEREYHSSDKEIVKTEVKQRLGEDAVYRAVYDTAQRDNGQRPNTNQRTPRR